MRTGGVRRVDARIRRAWNHRVCGDREKVRFHQGSSHPTGRRNVFSYAATHSLWDTSRIFQGPFFFFAVLILLTTSLTTAMGMTQRLSLAHKSLFHPPFLFKFKKYLYNYVVSTPYSISFHVVILHQVKESKSKTSPA